MEHPGQIPPSHLKASWAASRKRLFKIIEDLVLWENTTNEVVLERARSEIRKSWHEVCELNKEHPQAAELFNPDKLPAFHDPFAGGGSIPLEAQRLGLEAYASDLNPVAVLINKAMIEIPPKFAGRAPVGPIPKKDKQTSFKADWPGATGLAEDVRRYGAWMREEAFKRIGHLYPKVKLPEEYGGGEATVIAWLWARTVKSPNPAFSHVDVPLVSTFILSSKAGKEAYVQPVIEGGSYRFEVKTGTPPEGANKGTTAGKRAGFLCLMSATPLDYNYIRTEGTAGRIGQKLMAIVAEGPRSRVYLAPSFEMESIAHQVTSEWKPETKLHGKCRVNVSNYGFDCFGDLFTPRQLVALNTFSDLIQEVREKVKGDALAAGMADDGQGIDACGTGATAYADAVAVYLACAISKVANIGSTIASWMNDRGAFRETFARQAIPMTWDYAEANPFSDSGGSFFTAIDKGVMAIAALPTDSQGMAGQENASIQSVSKNKLVSTDPPYYDNIGYADLSDFFYVWMRCSLRSVYPSLFSTIAVPKAEELVATPYRHGTKEKAEAFFLKGMTEAMHRIADQAQPVFPTTIYYAFKQSDTSETGTGNTGWETFLDAVLRAGFSLTGTWPMRTEGSGRALGRLADRLHYLNSSGDKAQDTTRFWFDTRANLRREMEDRKKRFDLRTDVREKMADVLKKLAGGAKFFDGVHVFTPHADVPDDSSLRLVFLTPDQCYSREETRLAFNAALEYIRNNGTKPRYRGNRLLFLAPDHGSLTRLYDCLRTAMAWGSIVDDIAGMRLVLDTLQVQQAKKELQTAEEVLPRVARECYKWFLCPVQPIATDPDPQMEVFPLNTSSSGLGGEIENVCVENELVITTWSPIHLRTELKKFYWKDDKPAIGALAFWEDTLRYIYLPRLKTRDVLAQTITKGAASRDFYGTAYGQHEGAFDGFKIGDPHIQLDDTLLLIEIEAAKKYEADQAAKATPFPKTETGTIAEDIHGFVDNPDKNGKTSPPENPTEHTVEPKSKTFIGTAEVNAATAKMRLVQIADEIISILAGDSQATVKVSVEITADFPEGVSDQIKRAISENATTLGFKNKTWE